MKRREFLAVTGAAAVGGLGRWAPWSSRQAPTLGPAVFAARMQRLQTELRTRKLDLFAAEPGTNFQYLTGYNPGRSERLILLLASAVPDTAPTLICPSFEVERLKRNTGIADVRGWEEHDDPWGQVFAVGERLKPRGRPGMVAVEADMRYHVYSNLTGRLGGWRFVSGAPVTERLRIIKSAEELALIRRAIDATEAAIAATFTQLQVGMTERDVAQLLSREMAGRGSPGGGLVQFGPSSALPHGGPSAGKLERETVVLIDAGSRVEGYTSDVTRTIWFGDAAPDEFKQVFNLVHDAQTAAMQAGKPFVTQCQELDRLARKVITDGGYGQFFTHRLGHGMGMDGHEVPYLVEGNAMRLEPGMVFTIEPGIYQLGKWGVRIEDDCVMTDTGIEVMSHRPAKL